MKETTESAKTDVSEELSEPVSLTRLQRFQQFKRSQGRELFRLLNEAEQLTNEMEEQAKNDYNACNQKIVEFNQLRQLSFGRHLPDTRFVLSEDEFECMQRIKELKVEVN